MKKKNGFNIMLFVFITIFLTGLSCRKTNKTPASEILMRTDREFSSMSASQGMHKAFLHFIADSGVLLRDQSFPLKGRNNLYGLFEKSSDTSFILTWEPLYGKISASGDLGYTYGIFIKKLKTTGEESRGSYVTIWEKQSGGSWRFVLDSGTQGLPAEENQ